MEEHFRRKVSAVLLAALFLSWGAVLAFADSPARLDEATPETNW